MDTVKLNDMKIIYLHHSGFAILANGFTIIIDFYEDSESESQGIVHRELLKRDGRLYVLSSHFHSDHFNRTVLEWKNIKSDITYIFSHDIYKRRKIEKNTAVWLKKGEEYSDENIRIKAFGSTDVGISFMIEAEGKTLFHAGDLNNWHWMDESTEEEWKGEEQKFLNELRVINKEYKKIDIVMFPIDPRLGKEYMRGGIQFINAIQISTFTPMHFWNNYDAANKFQEYVRSCNIKSPDISNRGQIFNDL